MANAPLQPGVAPANAMSRRGVIGALAVAPVLAASVAARANIGPAKEGSGNLNMHTSISLPTCHQAEWDQLVATCRRAKAHEEAVQLAHNQCEEEYFRRMPAAPEKPKSLGFSDDMTLGEIKRLPPDKSWEKYERAMTKWGAQCRDVHRQVLSSAETEWIEAGSRTSDALAAVLAHAAPSLAILGAKVDLACEIYGEEALGEDQIPHILADIRRLVGGIGG